MIEAALGEEASAQAILQRILTETSVNFPEEAEARALLDKLEG